MSAVALGGCGREPEGQVVAVVNGKEVTASELQAEAAALGLTRIDKRTRDQLLRQVIDRNLLAEAARKAGLDNSPFYLAQRHRMEQGLLASLAARKTTEGITPPTQQEAARFARENPALFGQNEQLSVQVIKFSPANALKPGDIAAIKTLGEAERLLKGKVQDLKRGVMPVETRSMPPALASKIRGLRTGEVFFLVENDAGVFGVITDRRPAPVPEQQALEVAKRVLQEQRASGALKAMVEDERRAAKIEYQPGYGDDGAVSDQSAPADSGKSLPNWLALAGVAAAAGLGLLFVFRRRLALPRFSGRGPRVYRLYFLHPEHGNLETPEKVIATDDAEAIGLAEAQAGGRTAELWHGGRKVQSFAGAGL